METYKVQPGDSLSKISQIKYGDFSMVDEIARLNNISNVNLILPGQVLRLPEVQEAEVTVIDQNGNAVASKSKNNWLPLLIGGVLVAGGIYLWISRKKKGKKGLGLGSVDVLLFKKPKDSDLKVGMKVAYNDVNGEFTKIGTIKSKEKGLVTLIEGGQFAPDELRLLKKSNKQKAKKSFDKYYDVAYSNKNGPGMIAKRVAAKSESEAKRKVTKEMQASKYFDKVTAVIPL